MVGRRGLNNPFYLPHFHPIRIIIIISINVPMAIIDESLDVADKIGHQRGHLDLLLGVEHAAQVDRSDLHGAVPSQDRVRCRSSISICSRGE